MQRFQQHCQKLGLHAAGLYTEDEDPTVVALVLGSAGPQFTTHACQTFPNDPNPVDRATREAAQILIQHLPAEITLLHVSFPFDHPPQPFLTWASQVGLGQISRLGILMHPQFGPWWGLRMALHMRVTQEVRAQLKQTFPTPGTTHLACLTCTDAPCISACPGDALPPGEAQSPQPLRFEPAFELQTCLGHLKQEGCSQMCAARAACPVGAEWRYTDEVHQHHHQALRAWIREDF